MRDWQDFSQAVRQPNGTDRDAFEAAYQAVRKDMRTYLEGLSCPRGVDDSQLSRD